MVEQTIEKVEKAMREDPHTWAKIYLELKKEFDELELLVTKHQIKMKDMLQ